MSRSDIDLHQPFLVIMPVWNRSYFTRLSINSLMKFGPFNLVHSLTVFDNNSEEIDNLFLSSNLISVVRGNFPNANYCLQEIKNYSIPDHIHFIMKMDNDIELLPGFFQTILKSFIDNPRCGTIFFAKQPGHGPNYASDYHGGVFVTRRSLFDRFSSFPLSDKYPGCDRYHKFVQADGYHLFSIPDIAIDLSYAFPVVVKTYIDKGWMRAPI